MLYLTVFCNTQIHVHTFRSLSCPPPFYHPTCHLFKCQVVWVFFFRQLTASCEIDSLFHVPWPALPYKFHYHFLPPISHQIEEDSAKLEGEKTDRKRKLFDRHKRETAEFNREISSHGLEQLSINDIKQQVFGGSRPLSMIETSNNSSPRNVRRENSFSSSFTWWGGMPLFF